MSMGPLEDIQAPRDARCSQRVESAELCLHLGKNVCDFLLAGKRHSAPGIIGTALSNLLQAVLAADSFR